MGEFTSYWLYQKYVSTDSGQTYVPVYPAEYSINGDGTMPLSAKSEYDEACGYVPPTPTAIYRWVDMDISTDYICDECGQYPFKLYATYSGGGEYTVSCNGSSTLTSGETRGYSGESYSAMITAIVGDCVETIGNQGFFYFKNLKDVTISDSVKKIGTEAFWECESLSSVTFGSGLTSIEHSAFADCDGLTNVVIPDSVETIGVGAFQQCHGLTSITLPSGLTTLEWRLFAMCTSLSSITIPSSVTTINKEAFEGCSRLTSVTIPSAVTFIGYDAFLGCGSLTAITCLATTPPTLEIEPNTSRYTQFGIHDNYPIYVPASSVNTYKTATGWSEYASRIQAIS